MKSKFLKPEFCNREFGNQKFENTNYEPSPQPKSHDLAFSVQLPDVLEIFEFRIRVEHTKIKKMN